MLDILPSPEMELKAKGFAPTKESGTSSISNQTNANASDEAHRCNVFCCVQLTWLPSQNAAVLAQVMCSDRLKQNQLFCLMNTCPKCATN
jgi:hypothetical protein